MKNIFRIFILFSIGTNILIFSSISSFPQDGDNDIKVIYVETESREVPRKGDRIGIRIILYFDGTIEKYSLHIGMEDELVAVNQISQSDINKIDRLFSSYDFINYPDKIPFSKTPMWPSSTKGVKYCPSENSELKSFHYSTNSDHKYIPLGFFDFIKELRTTLFSYLN